MRLQPGPNVMVGIVTTDADASARFYGDVLGLPALPDERLDGARIKRFQIGNSALNLIQFEGNPEDRLVGRSLGSETGIRYLALDVPDIDAVIDTCRGAGFQVLEGPTQARPGIRIALVADGDGNVVEFVGRDTAQQEQPDQAPGA